MLHTCRSLYVYIYTYLRAYIHHITYVTLGCTMLHYNTLQYKYTNTYIHTYMHIGHMGCLYIYIMYIYGFPSYIPLKPNKSHYIPLLGEFTPPGIGRWHRVDLSRSRPGRFRREFHGNRADLWLNRDNRVH